MKDIEVIDGVTYYIDYEIPKDDSVIWRFLDLAKFISLLKERALFMTRADKFEDQFEGAVCALADSDKYDAALTDYYSEVLEGKPVGEQLIENEHHAIQLLKKAIGRPVEIGRIEYIDYSKEWPNANEALWRKRQSFEYEHEVRVRMITEGGLSPTPPEFMSLPVDLDELIEFVYVSPMAESWFKDVVEDVLRKYGLEKKVFHSALDDKALF